MSKEKEADSKLQGRRGFLGKFGQIVIGSLGAISFAKANTKLTPEQVVKAWESPEYRRSLTESQWLQLPEHPAGEIERSEFSGNLMASGNNCSGNNCSGNNCSGNNCSGDNCSGNNCSGNNCSGNDCSGNNCGSSSMRGG